MLRLTALASVMAVLSAGTAFAQTPGQATGQTTPQPTSPPQPAAPAPPQAGQEEKILLQADVIIEDRTTLVTVAEGNVEVRYQGKVLRADKLIFDQNRQSVRAQGRVQVVDETGTVTFAEELEGDQDLSNGFATGFAARLGGNSVATARSAIRVDGNKNVLEQAVYSGCKICEGENPTWQLRARTAMLDQKEQMISYQDAVLEIKGIPVFYVPWFAHPDPSSKRRSGFLAPDAGISSKIGVFYEQPYYLALSPHQDVTISPTISQEVNPLVKVDYRKRFFSGEVLLESSFTNEQEFDSDGEKFGDKTWRSHLFGYGAFNINQDWKWGFGVERQTDDLYDLRYDIDSPSGGLGGLFASQPRQLLTQLYTTGQTEDFYLESGLFTFQGLREGDDDARFAKVASAYTQKTFDFGSAGQLATDFSAVGLFRDIVELRPVAATPGNPAPASQRLLDTMRASASADWGTQVIFGPGLVFQPFAEGRGDFYSFEDDQGGGLQKVGRFLGVAGTQISLPFVRRGKNVDVFVEPIVMLAYGTPDANDDGIPNEDSQVFEADESNLFKPNPINGYDLWEGGARASVGISASANIGKNVEFSGLFGRRWREDPDPAFNQLSNLSTEKSDYVSAVRLKLGTAFSVGSRLRMDDNLDVNRIDVDSTFDVWNLAGTARYFKVDRNAQNLSDEGITLAGRYKITDRISLIGDQTRNITANENIRLSLGLAYQDDCSFFSLSYERSGGRDRTLGPSESIRFNFVLTGLGGVSDNSYD